MLTLLMGLALAGPGELREQRIEALEYLEAGGVPGELSPRRGRNALARHYVDEQGRIYGRAEVFELLGETDPTHMRYFWRDRRKAHAWATVMVIIPPPWGFGALVAHGKWRQRANRDLERALGTYNTLSTAGDDLL